MRGSAEYDSRESESPQMYFFHRVRRPYYLLKDHRPGGFYVRIKLPNIPMMEVLPQRGG